MPSKAAELDERVEHHRRGEDDVPAAGLDPGHRAALVAPERRQRADQLAQLVGLDHEPLHAEVNRAVGRLRRGGEVAYRAADPDQAPPRRREPVQRGQRRADVRPQAGELLLLGRPRAGQELLGHPDRAEPERRDPARVSVVDLDQLHAAAAEVEHDAVGERGRVDRRDVAEASLVLRRQRLDRQPGRGLRLLEELLAVGRLADRAGGDDVDVVGRDPVGAAEALEHGERLHPAGDRRFAELPGGAEAGADPDRLIELVGALPPGARGSRRTRPAAMSWSRGRSPRPGGWRRRPGRPPGSCASSRRHRPGASLPVARGAGRSAAAHSCMMRRRRTA